MRNHEWKLEVLAVAAALLIPLGAAAQSVPGPRGATRYDLQTVTTVRGQVVAVEHVPRGRHEGVHLKLATGTEEEAVLLGPAFYVDRQPLQLAKGDQVEVTGSRRTIDGRRVIVAQQVRRGDQVLSLRDAGGVPLWRGQGRAR